MPPRSMLTLLQCLLLVGLLSLSLSGLASGSSAHAHVHAHAAAVAAAAGEAVTVSMDGSPAPAPAPAPAAASPLAAAELLVERTGRGAGGDKEYRGNADIDTDIDIDTAAGVFSLPGLERSSIGFTLSFSLVSFPLRPGGAADSEYVTLARVALGGAGGLELALEALYPQMRPVLSLRPAAEEGGANGGVHAGGSGSDNSTTAANASKPELFRCVGRHRVAAYSQRLTAQLSYAQSSRVLSLLLFAGPALSLSSKCTFRTDQAADFVLSDEPSTLTIAPVGRGASGAAAAIGFLSAVEYHPRILTVTEIMKRFQKPFFRNAVFKGKLL
jgi:hypothetical protein